MNIKDTRFRSATAPGDSLPSPVNPIGWRITLSAESPLAIEDARGRCSYADFATTDSFISHRQAESWRESRVGSSASRPPRRRTPSGGLYYFAASRTISILKRYFNCIELSCFGYPEGSLAISALENVKCRKEKLFADLIGEVSPIDAAAKTPGPGKKSNCMAKGGGAIAVWARSVERISIAAFPPKTNQIDIALRRGENQVTVFIPSSAPAFGRPWMKRWPSPSWPGIARRRTGADYALP
jgi:hypothetical protein